MHTLEYEIVQNLNIFELKKSLEVYLDLFDNLTLENQDLKSNEDSLRSMKNFLIYLNSILYINYYEKNNSKENYFLKRNAIVEKIEKSNKLSELRSLGLEVLEFHFEFNNKIKNKNQHYIVNKAIKYMKENLNEDLNLDKVANQIHISSNYLSFLFSKNLNYSFSEYLNMLKIEKSKKLLKNSNLSILEVALESGFSSQSYFCYVFKNLEGISPKKYKNISN